jgi:hypothetical protein
MAAAAADIGREGQPIPNVLVLCQRRSSSSSDRTHVEKTVEALLNFIEVDLVEMPNFRIRFCTPCNKDMGECSDYNLELNMSTLHHIKGFMKRESPLPINSFDFVILHTCPIVSMDFQAIWNIMTPGGTMVITNYFGHREIVQAVQNITKGLHQDIVNELSTKINNYFEAIQSKPGYYSRKEIQDGGTKVSVRNRRGSKKKSRKNTLRYKAKRSRSYRNRHYHETKRPGSEKLK